MDDMRLFRAGLQLHASLQVTEVMHCALDLVNFLCPQMTSGRIYLIEGERLVFGAAIWPGQGQQNASVRPPAGSAVYDVLQTGQEIYQDRNGHGVAILALPLKSADALVGVLAVYFSNASHPGDDLLDLLRLFAMQVGVALANARRHELVSRQANTDALTGLPNRRAFDERLETEVRRSSRYQHPFTLMMVDLDGFKGINDLLGHPAGDRVLQSVAQVLSHALRDTDFSARYGGDEFAIILPETPCDVAQGMAERLVEAVRGWSGGQPGESSGRVALSIGLASYPEHALTPAGLLTLADKALYAMKQNNRNGSRPIEQPV